MRLKKMGFEPDTLVKNERCKDIFKHYENPQISETSRFIKKQGLARNAANTGCPSQMASVPRAQ
jgi:hypothetical protein